jgi:hypothetical protein
MHDIECALLVGATAPTKPNSLVFAPRFGPLTSFKSHEHRHEVGESHQKLDLEE